MCESKSSIDSKITVRGSCELIKSYLNFAINSVLYQRGLYPIEDFKYKEEFGITLMISSNSQVKAFLDRVLTQMEVWLLNKQIEKVGMVITDIAAKKVVELWEFNVEYVESENGRDTSNSGEKPEGKTLEKIQGEIRSILRQILSTISVLPLLDTRCSFDINMHLRNATETPPNWQEVQDPNFQANEELRFRQLSTGFHGVKTRVFYCTYE